MLWKLPITVCCPSRLILARHIVTQLRQACSSCLRLFLHIPAGHAQRLTRPVQCMKLCSCHTALWHCRTRHLLHSRLLGMGKSGKSYYAVKMGRAPGQIFRTWPECESQVKGFKGAQYKGFKSEGEALTYLGQRHAASQGLGISQISQQISKRVSHAAGTKGKSAAQLLGQHAYSNIADVKEDADYDSRQASSRAAGPSGRPCAESQQTYSLAFDGGARGNPGPSGAGAVLHNDSTGEELAIVSEHLGRQTNNYAEYTGLIRGLQAALTCGVRHIRIKGDSKLVVMQVHNAGLAPLHKQASAMRQQFDTFILDHIYRDANKRADQLSNVAMDGNGWTGFRDSQGNIWDFDELPAHDSAAANKAAPRKLFLPTLVVRRQGNSLAAQSHPWVQ